ncbi:hypothetical protein CGZ93_09940 [Enemella dayhoffiae]|uniref:Uncharacterized protein n=1 Tax=Enemella dayhoffiae TaxID=2016507 RepID=A0A255H2R0_9ACTN|nr:hypothetical protein [Enemella dayhoffiae]OYO21616.1 hypothetical protein CGZ93_09940 [Enemella dayhoffiae]
MPRAALLWIAASLMVLLVAGCAAPGSAATRRVADDGQGRSVVGVAKRSDGRIVLVTAWCLGERREQPRIASYDGRAGQELYAAHGQSSDPVTVHEVGRPASGFELIRNQPLPVRGLLIAHNAGERGGWLAEQAYPSAVAVFGVADLPTSDAPMPPRLITGDRQRTTSEQLISAKCTR